MEVWRPVTPNAVPHARDEGEPNAHVPSQDANREYLKSLRKVATIGNKRRGGADRSRRLALQTLLDH